MLPGHTLPSNHSFADARQTLVKMAHADAAHAAVRILDFVVETKPASVVLSEAMAIADADLQVTLAALCLLSQGQHPIFDARLVYEDEKGGRHVLHSTPAKGVPFKDPASGAIVEDPESRMTFRFDVMRSLMERAA